MRDRRVPQPRGFTLVEASLSVAIVGVLLVTAMGVFGGLARSRGVQTESRLATLLAQQLMTEIMQTSFQQPGTTPPFGPQSGQTRSGSFTAVDCYNGYTASPPVEQDGAAMVEYAGWSETAAVAFVSPGQPDTTVTSSTLKRITVTVTAPSKKTYTLVGWRSKFGAYELTPSSQTTYLTGVAVKLQAPTAPLTVYSGAHPLNVTTSQ
jgi:prepilin-type N-terminal cleavage/methylation domain-containing protein